MTLHLPKVLFYALHFIKNILSILIILGIYFSDVLILEVSLQQ